MQISQQDLIKSIVESVGKMVDARGKTTETLLMAEIRASEDRQGKKLEEVKVELKTEINNSKGELKDEIKAMRTGVAKRIVEQDERLEVVEESTRTSSKH